MKMGNKVFYLSIVLLTLIFTNLFLIKSLQKHNFITSSLPQIVLTPSPSLSPMPTSNPSPLPTIAPSATPSLKLIFGIGSQAGHAMDYKLVKESPVKMLTSWYNGPNDLNWMRVQQND